MIFSTLQNNILVIIHRIVFISLIIMFSLVQADSDVNNKCDLNSAISYFHQGKTVQAINEFLLCENQKELHSQSHFYLGIGYRNMGNFEKALQYLKSVIGKDSNVNYYVEYAYTYEKIGKYEKALENYITTLLEYPNNFAALLGEARLYHWTGKIKLSIEKYRKLLLAYPDTEDVVLGLAYVLMADRKLIESRKLFELIIKKNRNNSSAKNGLSMLKDIKNYQASFISEYISFGGKSTKAEKINFLSTPSFALKWGGGLIHYQQPIDSFSIEAVPTNRYVLNEYSLFAAYKYSTKNEILVEYSLQDLYENEFLHKVKLENYHSISPNKQISVGVTQAYLNSSKTNTLTTIGLSIQSRQRLEFEGRIYYSSDKSFFDSQSLSSSIIKTTKNNTRLQFGMNINRVRKNVSSTFFGKISTDLSKDVKLNINAAQNSKDQYTQISIGIIYEF